MTSTVWASNAMINPRMLRPITHSYNDGIDGPKTDFAITCGRKNAAGEPLGDECFPEQIYVKKDADTNYDKLPDLFFAGSYWVVSGATADVMHKFDLGQGNLYPTKVFRKDRKTPIGERWFCLNFGNVKEALDAQQSTNICPFVPGYTDCWNPPTNLKDGQLAVSSAALGGPDVWIDPQIREIFFLSDPLAMALKDAGVARAFGLKKCRVV